MPIISEFYGIKIMMFWNDHYPPHFHAQYGDNKILVDIQNATVLKGIFPSRQLKIVSALKSKVYCNSLRELLAHKIYVKFYHLTCRYFC